MTGDDHNQTNIYEKAITQVAPSAFSRIRSKGRVLAAHPLVAVSHS
jgi:hypothetical protein